MNMTFEEIQKIALELGFTAVGYAPASQLADESERYMHALENGHFASLEYLKRNLEKRFNPQLLVDGAKSVLVFLAPYGSQRTDEHIDILFTPSNGGSLLHSKGDLMGRYKVAQYALGEDYHTVIRGKLNEILQRMKELDPQISGRVFVDTAPVLERAWAVQAGLGFIGKNNFFISREHGIRNFIGVIISSYAIDEIEVKKPEGCRGDEKNLSGRVEEFGKKYCGNCTKCIDSCPTGALCAPYTLDARKCTSYLTIEDKGSSLALNIENGAERDGWIFGCDACMNACPWNSRNDKGWEEFNQKEEPLPASHLRRR